MTNLIAIVYLIITTNWTTLGTYQPASGVFTERIQIGRVITNTVMAYEWAGVTNRSILERAPGPWIKARYVREGGPGTPIYVYQLSGVITTNTIDMVGEETSP